MNVDISSYIVSPYGKKDRLKFLQCNKLISRGVEGSSSYSYSFHPLANTGKYSMEDCVGVSVNGNRRNRLPVDLAELHKAVEANCLIVTFKDRMRPYNIGEREVATYLRKTHKEIERSGIWIPANRKSFKWRGIEIVGFVSVVAEEKGFIKS